MPTPTEITEEKQKILAFCDVRLAERTVREVSYGRYGAPISFTLSFDGEDTALLNYIETDYPWRCRGLFSFVLSYLENARGIKYVGIKSAHTEQIQGVIVKLGYVWHPDDYYEKAIHAPAEIVALDEIPGWLRKLVCWFRKPRPASCPY